MITVDFDEDFVPRFPGELTDEQAERGPILLQDAAFWLSVWVPGLADAVSGGNGQAQTAAKLLAVNMVRRAITSPDVDDGVQSATRQAGPYQYSVVYRNPDGNLFLYASELDAIRSLLRSNPATAVSMMVPGL